VTTDKGAKPTRRGAMPLGASSGVLQRAAETATASLRMRSVAPSSPAALEFPVSTRVATLKPTLRWRAEGGGDDFTLVLLDAKGKQVWKGAAKPEGTRPGVTLAPASRYSWTVIGARGPVGQAEFETLGADAIARAERAGSEARSFSGRVVHALLLQDLGAQQEAREAWARLAAERPDLPELANLAR
jgi:hypothetical protein